MTDRFGEVYCSPNDGSTLFLIAVHLTYQIAVFVCETGINLVSEFIL